MVNPIQISFLPSHIPPSPNFLPGTLILLGAQAKILNSFGLLYLVCSNLSTNCITSALKICPEFDFFSAHLHFDPSPLLSHLFYLILTVCYSLCFHCCSLSVFSQQSNQCDILRHKLCYIFCCPDSIYNGLSSL